MRRTALLAFVMIVPMALAGCSSGGGANAAEEETKVKDAMAVLSASEGTPGIFVKGRDVVVNYAQRPANFAAQLREAALAANKAVNGKQVRVYVVDSAEVATAIPAQGSFLCSITANDNRMAGNNC
jgi:hypothetical protein